MQNLVCSYKLEVHSTLRHKICDCDPGDRGLNNFNIYLRIIAFLSKNIFRCGTCWENYEKKFPIHAFVRPLLCEDPTLSPAVTAWTFDLQNSPLRLLKIFPIIFNPPPSRGSWFKQTWIFIIHVQKCFVGFFLALWIFRNNISWIHQPILIFTCKGTCPFLWRRYNFLYPRKFLG